MAFPDTRQSLIRRIVVVGDTASWSEFVASYWRATCRFAMRLADLQWVDAEDVTSQVFEILSRKSLLESWLSRPEARFKTLLCTVVRNVVQNTVRSRKQTGRQSLLDAEAMEDLGAAAHEELDLFYAIWAQELLLAAVQSVTDDYHGEGKGDYFRVLYGRICEQLPFGEIAKQLDLTPTDVDNYFRHARRRLADRLEILLKKDVSYSTTVTDWDTEFQLEWGRLAEFIQRQGGLEAAVRKAHSEKTT